MKRMRESEPVEYNNTEILVAATTPWLKNFNNSLHFTYEKSILMASYLLCGFANFASIGIQVGGISVIAPMQRKNLSELGLKAMIGGTIVSLMSATIAGAILG